ncbi:SMI1/KNR4 family protein [Winogradskyella sp. PG-2]|uniref:SMI1/KNR4 family protein n=1 Tax=Winogradskyella sp. PG-2 TaxID=754409 RepID=UPI0004588E7C|nr:SMI1/KNR4 family protein [Winogradskyella sp. PG-2]BAO77209.1 hypothetical protein WPG_2979 [Winogradskyella sp. PG-2]
MNKSSEDILIIEKKIFELNSLDKTFKIFGSEDHKYEFSSSISENEVIEFEKTHNIILPSSYREFILKFGNSGCGPYYGLIKFKYGILNIPHSPKESEIIKLSKEMRFNTFWNLEDYSTENYQEWGNEYDDSKWSDGMLKICHEGCGYFINIVITGKERGNMWLDARVYDGGIFPVNYYKGKEKTNFTVWYLDWLNHSIDELSSKK